MKKTAARRKIPVKEYQEMQRQAHATKKTPQAAAKAAVAQTNKLAVKAVEAQAETSEDDSDKKTAKRKRRKLVNVQVLPFVEAVNDCDGTLEGLTKLLAERFPGDGEFLPLPQTVVGQRYNHYSRPVVDKPTGKVLRPAVPLRTIAMPSRGGRQQLDWDAVIALAKKGNK